MRLHELGLLPEKQRLAFVSKVSAYAFDGDDLYAIESSDIQGVFTQAELAEFRRRWREELMPKLSDIRWTWQSNHDSDRNPDDHIRPLIDALEVLKKEFVREPRIADEIQTQITLAEEWIAEKLAQDSGPQSRPPRVFGEVDGSEPPPAPMRSIFDDIDE